MIACLSYIWIWLVQWLKHGDYNIDQDVDTVLSDMELSMNQHPGNLYIFVEIFLTPFFFFFTNSKKCY